MRTFKIGILGSGVISRTYTDTVYQKTDEAMTRKDMFYELPELSQS